MILEVLPLNVDYLQLHSYNFSFFLFLAQASLLKDQILIVVMNIQYFYHLYFIDILIIDDGQLMNIVVIDQLSIKQEKDPFTNIRKYSTNLYNQQTFEDDQFKLDVKGAKNIIKKRLKDIYPKGQSIFHSLKSNNKNNLVPPFKPSYLSEIQMIPQWHFKNLIQPKQINDQGFYHVVVVHQGKMIKILVDDYVIWDELRKEIVTHPFYDNKQPWLQIILKVWAKLCGGYELIQQAQPFSFIKAFTYPDWNIFNPGLQNLQEIVLKIGGVNKKQGFYVGRTKADVNVGYYGLIPNCSSYRITGYNQEYGNIFLKIRSYVGGQWNGCSQIKIQPLSQVVKLQNSEFLIPIKTFINIFHLIYFTTNKYDKQRQIFYEKNTINLDARQSKAAFIYMSIISQIQQQQEVNLNIHLPLVRSSDLINKRQRQNIGQNERFSPHCKIAIGKCLNSLSSQKSISYAQSLKETILRNESVNFISHKISKYQHVAFKKSSGQINQQTFLMKLKPGKYLIRLKIEKLLPQYRIILNATSTTEIQFEDCKLSKKQQMVFLSQIMMDKGRKQQKNVIYPNPKRKEYWIMANDDFQGTGYGSILFQSARKDSNCIVITVDQRKLKEEGYRLKNKINFKGLVTELKIKEGQSIVIVLKKDIQVKNQSIWPPSGISISFSPLQIKARQ